MTIQDISLAAVQAMINAGYTPYAAWNEYESTFAPITRLHVKYGKTILSEDVFSEYIQFTEGRYARGDIAYGTYRRLVSGATRLLAFSRGGEIRQPHINKLICIEGHFGELHDYFSEHCDKFRNAEKRMAISDLRTHFLWLQQNGCKDISHVSENCLRNYLVYCAAKYQAQTLSLLKSRLKRSYAFFSENGYTHEDFSKIFSFKVNLPKKIKPAVSHEDIASVLSQIDRTLPRGKRDYAILLLGTTTGMRSCDIAGLKLSDIDWRKGEIFITQQKTGQPLVLPLTRDVAEALQDYILNGRISPVRTKLCDYSEVFLSVKTPCAPLTRRGAVRNVYNLYRNKANLSQSSFHDLRRAVGKNMVTAEVPVNMVAEVLGITDLDTTKQYISLDNKRLKECALDFSGIAPKGGVSDE